MDFKAHLETAWKLTLKYLAALIVMTLVMLVISIITFGILAPVVMAGYMNSILLAIRDQREPNVKDIFSHMNLILPLLGFEIVVFILALTGFSLLIIPGMFFVLAVAYVCLFMLPLMTDKKLGILDAVKESFALVRQGNTVDNIAVFIIFIGILAVGSTTFIGSLFTQPFATVFLMSVYKEKTSQTESNSPTHN